MKHFNKVLWLASLVGVIMGATPGIAQRVVVDSMARQVQVPDKVDRVICSGPGCLRLLSYLQGGEYAVGVDDIETRRRKFDARPYAIANPAYRELPVFGEFRGHDDPERILTLQPQPQVIFKTYPTMGHDPIELQRKTSVPLVVLDYGDLGANRAKLYHSLEIMGTVIGRENRAAEVIAFFEDSINGLHKRTADIAAADRPSVFIGGVAHKGPHGYQSTEPLYPPFVFVNALNVAAGYAPGSRELSHADVAKESILIWDPDILFVDLSTVQLGDEAGGLWELKNDATYQLLTAVQNEKVYGLLPYNWYTTNYGSILANSYFIGTVLYPERFADLDPVAEADRIFDFLVGAPVFARLNESFGGLAFGKIKMHER